jgi:hypothetical protein
MSLLSRLTNLFRRSGLDREIDAELRARIDMRVEDNVRAGTSPEAARRDALLRFGNPLVMGGVIATMMLIGLVATWIPARHALAVDPARLLREE